MTIFEVYLRLGFDHILDVNGYDHVLFIVALCAVYQVREWRKILILVSAFTLGHSLTLALATLKLIHINSNIIEFLIPLTIFITALANLFRSDKVQLNRKFQPNYFYATFFGLIHGLGFSTYLGSLLGKEQSILQPLLAFNIGIEIGQIIIVAIFMFITFLFTGVFNVPRREWTTIISSAVGGVALTMIIENKFW